MIAPALSPAGKRLLTEAVLQAREHDREYLRALLIEARGNTPLAAKASGIPLATFDRAITRLGLRDWLAEMRASRGKPNAIGGET